MTTPRLTYLGITTAAAIALTVTAAALFTLTAPGLARPDAVDPIGGDEGLPSFPKIMPRGLPPLEAPADNPFTEAAFNLGRELFTDPILSIDRSISCASCHRPDQGFTSRQRIPDGVRGRKAARHAPALLNRAWGRHHSWDGSHPTLEKQCLAPIANRNEMALPVRFAVRRLQRNLDYVTAFGEVYGVVTEETLGKALATFVRGLVYGDTPVDRFHDGDRDALTARERAGQWIYESKGRCWRCHVRPHFTDESFHNTGVGVSGGVPRPGRFAVTKDEADLGRFKTPTLRGLTETAPYMHDGSLATLEDVVAFYRRGGHANPNLDRAMKPLDLTDEEAANLVAFLKALSRRPAPPKTAR